MVQIYSLRKIGFLVALFGLLFWVDVGLEIEKTTLFHDNSFPILQILELLQWLLATHIVSRLIRYSLQDYKNAENQNVFPPILFHFISAILYLIAIVIVANRVFEKEITTILATSGVISIVVGFALRDIFVDFFSGIAINLDGSLRVGNFICVTGKRGDKVEGRLVNISWRTTHLVSVENETIIIPNSELGHSVVVNRSVPTNSIEKSIEIPFPSKVDLSFITGVISHAMEHLYLKNLIVKESSYHIRISSLNENGATVKIIYQYDPCSFTPSAVTHNVLKYVDQHLKFSGIEHTQPQLLKINEEEKVETPKSIDSKSFGLFESIDLFSSLSKQELESLSKNAIKISTHKDELLINENSDDSSMYVIAKGVFAVCKDINQIPVEFRMLGPGSYFGEIALFTGAPRGASVLSKTDGLVFELKKSTVAILIKENEYFAKNLASIIHQRQMDTQGFVQGINDKKGELSREELNLFNKIRRYFN